MNHDTQHSLVIPAHCTDHAYLNPGELLTWHESQP